MGDLTKNFSRWEFACKCPCKADHMSETLVKRLQLVRDDYGDLMFIESSDRCRTHNEKANGNPNSEHIYGDAVDIMCHSSVPRLTLIELLLKHGFRRIGIHKAFIHAGIGKLKTQDVMWVY